MGFATPEVLSPVEKAEERLLGGLRTVEGVAFYEVAALHLRPDHPTVRHLVDLGLLVGEPDRLLPTAAGRRLLDRVTAELAGA
jgi:oxygen-independent coproporphyrinogen-3 oxidase